MSSSAVLTAPAANQAKPAPTNGAAETGMDTLAQQHA